MKPNVNEPYWIIKYRRVGDDRAYMVTCLTEPVIQDDDSGIPMYIGVKEVDDGSTYILLLANVVDFKIKKYTYTPEEDAKCQDN